MPTWDQGPEALEARWILNPVSLEELSRQLKLIWLEETAEAVRFEGAAGAVFLAASAG